MTATRFRRPLLTAACALTLVVAGCAGPADEDASPADSPTAAASDTAIPDDASGDDAARGDGDGAGGGSGECAEDGFHTLDVRGSVFTYFEGDFEGAAVVYTDATVRCG